MNKRGKSISTYTQILYHLVFHTKNSRRILTLERHDEMCRYIAGLLRNKHCFPYRLGGYLEHIHILFGLHPSVALSDLVRDIKLATTYWNRKEGVFPDFDGWQEGYGAFTCSWSVKEEVMNYIGGQKEHHRHKTFLEEYTAMLKRAGIVYDEKYIL